MHESKPKGPDKTCKTSAWRIKRHLGPLQSDQWGGRVERYGTSWNRLAQPGNKTRESCQQVFSCAMKEHESRRPWRYCNPSSNSLHLQFSSMRNLPSKFSPNNADGSEPSKSTFFAVWIQARKSLMGRILADNSHPRCPSLKLWHGVTCSP